MWAWKERYGGEIVEQLKVLGCSCDWSRQRFTLDPGLSRAVRTAFVRLYREGLIYRGDYMIHWCPRCETALSDIEVEHREVDGHLYYVRYPRGGGYVTVATTRPETMLGDTGLAVNPQDERYQGLIGKTAALPFSGAGSPSSERRRWTPSSGPGSSRSPPPTTPWTGRSESATVSPRSTSSTPTGRSAGRAVPSPASTGSRPGRKWSGG